MLPLDPVFRDRTWGRDCGEAEGATAPSCMLSAVRRTSGSSDCAASIFAERVIRFAIIMKDVLGRWATEDRTVNMVPLLGGVWFYLLKCAFFGM